MKKTSPSAPVSFDNRSFLINGRREFILSGEIHYARAPRELWGTLLDRSVECGLNCIAAYIFWNFHETSRGVYDFSGGRDLQHFLRLCAERNLHVILRLGPYCCAEWNYGGFPPYLRDEPGITIRTMSPPYLDRVGKYFEHLAAEIRPHLATNGGPVILVQVENEYNNVAARYGKDGERYKLWMAELAARVGLNVPTITCEGAVDDEKFVSVECVNGFSIPQERIDKVRKERPNQPLMWTELWPGWYDTWGYQEHHRDVRNIAFYQLRFISQGGAGWNYYMWYAGTNYGRTSMYLQCTRYGFDAPLDEHGRISNEGAFLSKLHAIVRDAQDLLLEGTRTFTTLPSGIEQTIWARRGKKFTLLVNPLQQKAAAGKVSLPPQSARLLDGTGKCLFDTQATHRQMAAKSKLAAWKNLPALGSWQSWQEPAPALRTDIIRSVEPLEQLALTHDESDYCGYSTVLDIKAPGEQRLEIPYGGDFFYLFLDGKLVAQSQSPFKENRGPTMPVDPHKPEIVVNVLDEKVSGFRHAFRFQAKPGKHRLDIQAVALGLIKGDWQVSDSMNTERKGIWQGVKLNGKKIKNWEMRPFLAGEKFGLISNPELVAWKASKPHPFTWHSAAFSLSPSVLKKDADFRIDATGLGKGMLFLNGHALGRHWLIEAAGYGGDEGWHDKQLDGLLTGPAGQPTQRYYHVPKCWLARENRLLIFEEQTASPQQVRLQVRG